MSTQQLAIVDSEAEDKQGRTARNLLPKAEEACNICSQQALASSRAVKSDIISLLQRWLKLPDAR